MFKSKKFWAVAIIGLSTITEIASSIVYHLCFCKTNYLETLYYTTQIISSFFVVGGVVVAVWQYYLSCQDTKTNLEILQVQRAIDLSEHYKDNILRYLPAIYYVFDYSGATKILEHIHPDKMQHFDQRELNNTLNQEQISNLKSLTAKKQFVQSVMEANDIYNLNLKFQKDIVIKNEAEKKETILCVNISSIIDSFMSELISQVLNNMEYFALHFRHNTADESVIYQSLHQTYFEAIKYLYYYICNNNDDPADKLYTNVIWLYKEWREYKKEHDKEVSEKENAAQRHGTVVGKKAKS